MTSLPDGTSPLFLNGDAEVVVRRESAGNAEITSHYFGGATSRGHVAIESGQLKITARERNPAGMPLEWIEVHIS
jgi:hypothetical protein